MAEYCLETRKEGWRESIKHRAFALHATNRGSYWVFQTLLGVTPEPRGRNKPQAAPGVTKKERKNVLSWRVEGRDGVKYRL